MGKTRVIAKPMKSHEEPTQSKAGRPLGKERLSHPELPSQHRSDEFKRVIPRQDASVDVSGQKNIITCPFIVIMCIEHQERIYENYLLQLYRLRVLVVASAR